GAGGGGPRGEPLGATLDADRRQGPAGIEQTHESDEVERSLTRQQSPGEGGGEVVRFRFIDGRRIADLHRHDAVPGNSAEELRAAPRAYQMPRVDEEAAVRAVRRRDHRGG